MQDIQIRGVNRDEKNIQMAKEFPNSRHFLTYRHSLRVTEVFLFYFRGTLCMAVNGLVLISVMWDLRRDSIAFLLLWCPILQYNAHFGSISTCASHHPYVGCLGVSSAICTCEWYLIYYWLHNSHHVVILLCYNLQF